MLRSLLAVLLLFVAIFWLPVWAQIALFVGAVFLLPNRWFFLVPAVFCDVFYSPTNMISFSNLKMTMIVLVSIIMSELIVLNMRVGDKYGILEK